MVEITDRTDELVRSLRREGRRLTPQRMAVLKIIAESRGHPSVEQIYDEVRREYPMTSLATVYKTIALLKELGQVLELGFGEGVNRYDGSKPYPHAHLICLNCHAIVDPQVEALETAPEAIAAQTGYRMVSHRLDFYGICPECQSNGPPGPAAGP